MNRTIQPKPISITLPLLNTQKIRSAKMSVLLMYAIAYLYSYTVWDLHPKYYLLLTILLIAFVEYVNRTLTIHTSAITAKLEYTVLLVSLITQGFLLSTHYDPYSTDDFFFFQVIAVHLLFIFYVLTRSQQHISQQFNWLSVIDGCRGIFVIPFSHFFIAIKILFIPSEVVSMNDSHKTKMIQLVKSILITLITLVLLTFAINRLRNLSDTFNQFAQQHLIHLLQQFVSSLFSTVFSLDMIPLLFVSLPVWLWLYGLIGGASFSHHFERTTSQTEAKLSRIQIFSAINISVVVTTLCVVYATFFVVSLQDLIAQLNNIPSQQALRASQASQLAVTGFWQLIQITLLNLFVLGFSYLFGHRTLWQTTHSKAALGVLLMFNLLFTLLAAWKLIALYIVQFGLTPLRLQSAWLISVILVATILAFIRLFKSITAFRYVATYFIVSYTFICAIYYYAF
ncbi:DUF4173 domain-containing protein [Aerococcaceae bacterium zg-BR9]|uniref:DUF4153 domain-containing protein n=1 Tax=Aerococcaceae bacterium zg-1292 TaxID=2774330 RepID=UPI0040645EB0|nr:DUF4173 domain-containing protein [Aerococcaceae bacterium zg-BR9]